MSILEYLSPKLAENPSGYNRRDYTGNPLTPDEIYEAFTGWISSRGMTLYPAQDEAVLEIAAGHNVVLATPTGSGKSTVAVAAHFTGLATGQRSYYTAPIKALVSEKFFDLIEIFGAENVGMITGDSAINADAPIICCTAEILANITLREGKTADVCQVIMDEFHFYSDPQRGWAWQLPLLELPQAQFLLMSATLGDTTRFQEEMTTLTGRESVLVASSERPIPLHFYYSTDPIQETVQELVQTKQAPVYIVHFSQKAALEQANALLPVAIASKEEKERIAQLIAKFRFGPGFGKALNKLVRAGIGIHHAGMLPKYRRLVERLAQAGLLKVICGTDTLGVGINVPIRTVLITALSKFDGSKNRRLRAREFHQIAGRAGRAGFDTAGTVVVQAPEHDIENARLLAKAQAKFGDDTKKINQSLSSKRKKAPEGFVGWSEKTFDQLVAAEPEPLTSSFDITHSMLLNLMQRPQNPVVAAYRILQVNHEPPQRRRELLRKAVSIYKELLTGGVIERTDTPDEHGSYLRLTEDLQDNFALNQPLSAFAVAAIELLDPDSPNYALDVLSLIEATLEPPHLVLYAQERKVKNELSAQLKADGVEYNERMYELDQVTYPQPLTELIEQAYTTYQQSAPWVARFEPHPKSVVRDMYERAMGFNDFVQYYALERGEGVLLRYLSDAYKALRQTVPESAVNDDLAEIIEWLGELVRQTDSSLVDEWEKLAAGEDAASLAADRAAAEIKDDTPPAVTKNVRAFRVMVRNALFRRVELFADERENILGELDEASGWDADAWADAMDDYFDAYDDIYTDAEARSPKLVQIDDNVREHPGVWKVQQTFADPEDNFDWGIRAEVNLAASDDAGYPVLKILSVGEF
ncbi:DEAD/DEAH box helicase [Rothia dentocariosa]|uniref:DEAD/DEAH box helicase n=1 Tax=Rothia dentocariosa TaxID=2047 RepID=UPI003C716E43